MNGDGDTGEPGENTDLFQFNSCHRSNDAYPRTIFRKPSLLATEFPACSGATTANLVEDGQGQYFAPDDVPQSLRGTDRSCVATVTIGGNFAGFGERAIPARSIPPTTPTATPCAEASTIAARYSIPTKWTRIETGLEMPAIRAPGIRNRAACSRTASKAVIPRLGRARRAQCSDFSAAQTSVSHRSSPTSQPYPLRRQRLAGGGERSLT